MRCIQLPDGRMFHVLVPTQIAFEVGKLFGTNYPAIAVREYSQREYDANRKATNELQPSR